MKSKGTTRRGFIAGAGAASALVALGARSVLASALDATTPRVPTAVDLEDSGPGQRRWMSVPMSRLVVNPFDFNTTLTPVQYNNAPDLPLHAGYYVQDGAASLRELLLFYRRPSGAQGGVTVAFEDDFSSLSGAWTGDAWVSRQIVNGELELTIEPGGLPYGVTQRTLTIDLDTAHYVQISVTQATGMWSLKVNDGTLATDAVLQGDTNQVGTLTYDIAAVTGWTGTRTFQLKVFAIGVGSPVLIDDIQVMGVTAALQTATSLETTWQPHQLPFLATYPGGAILQGSDFFFDESTLVRSQGFRVSERSGAAWVIAGACAGAVSWDGGRVVTVSGHGWVYAIALDTSALRADYFSSKLDLLAWTGARATPVSQGYWALSLAAAPSVVGVGFATAAEGAAAARSRATAPLSGSRAAVALVQRQDFWDRSLAELPHPLRFDLDGVPADGVAAADVWREHYRAWVFAIANALPAMPETGYHYPQIPAGKPSLWVYGAPGAQPSAAWESFLGIQFFAYHDPATAWAAYEGLMSLVGPDGALHGESLPSRKAQAAMVLYQLTGDTASLRGVYPALKRLLLWEMDHVYWIPPGATGDPNSRDAEFAFSLIIDMGYAQDIAGILGMPASEAAAWESRRQSLLQESLRWFWPTSTTEPSQYYEVTTGARNAGNTIWVSTGLHVELLTQSDYVASLEQRFLSQYDATAPFAGFPLPKYPDVSYTLYGLLERGMLSQAVVLANSAARDVTRANAFAEQYTDTGSPIADGVRPSLFGDCMMIDTIWIKNGYRMDRGWPSFVRMNDVAGGIFGLPVRGKALNLEMDPAAQAVRLSGSLVSETSSCRSLAAPLGRTVSLPAGCTT